MSASQSRPKVILRQCDAYDPVRIRQILNEGMEELGLRPHGRTLVKPNLVMAGPMFRHAHTRPEFMEGLLGALQDRALPGAMKELAMGERCGITVPTRHASEQAGMGDVCRKLGVKQYFFEEEPQVEIKYTHTPRLRDYVYTPEPVAKADFFVNAPKFKAHPWTTVTFSIKAYIGIQDDRHRLIDHDHRLNEKIADLQHIIQPQFIAIDAITAGQGRMLTPIPFDMNLIIMGNNQVAFDTVCSHIIGIDARTVDHIRLAHEHGFGPIDLKEIDVTGDVPLQVAWERCRTFQSGLVRVEKYFEGTTISAYAGPPPGGTGDDYCWGGCPGAIEEAIEILRAFDKTCDAKMPRIHVVFGAYQGPIPAKEGEKVIFIGDCARWEGNIGGELVQIRSVYKPRETKDPHDVTGEDIFAKMAKVSAKVAANRGNHVRFEGCPVSVAEHVLMLVAYGGLNNPYFDPAEAIPFTKAYTKSKATVAAKRLWGIPYQVEGDTQRGEAAPQEKEEPARG